MDSSSFASTLSDGDEVRLLTYIRPLRWHPLMPGHDGYSRAGSQLLSRASRTRTFTGFAGAGPTCSPSVSLLCNRDGSFLSLVIRLLSSRQRQATVNSGS
jgi:hypothetical protein